MFTPAKSITVLQSKKTRRMIIVIKIKAKFYIFCLTKISET